MDKQLLDKQRFFFEHYGLTENDLERYLGAALSAGGDYADLYFEYLLTSSISIDESMVKSATQGVSMGVGVRVIAGERTSQDTVHTYGRWAGLVQGLGRLVAALSRGRLTAAHEELLYVMRKPENRFARIL